MTPTLSLLVVRSQTGPGLSLRVRDAHGSHRGPIQPALAQAGFQDGDRVVLVPADAEPAVATIEIWRSALGWQAHTSALGRSTGRIIGMTGHSREFVVSWLKAKLLKEMAHDCEEFLFEPGLLAGGIIFRVVEREEPAAVEAAP
jgi:hypothetical protein